MRAAMDVAHKTTLLRRDGEAAEMWRAVYPALTTERSGMIGSLTARAEAQVLRLSLIYAVLDQADAITRQHLEAALAVWQYCEDSVRFIFGDATGNPIADRIFAALRSTPSGMAQDELGSLFGKNSAAKLHTALDELIRAGRIASQREETRGRPRTVWTATS